MRILIVAESVLSAEAIRRSLRHAPGCRSIGFVDARRPCEAAVREACADVVVVDELSSLSMLLERVREIRDVMRDSKIVLLAADMNPDRLHEAAVAGVDAAIAKSSTAVSIGMLIREVAAGNVFHSFAPPPAPSRVAKRQADTLTARELEILRLAAAGLSNSRIAAELWVTEQTVKFHLSNIYRKLGLANRTQASHFAHVHGLLGRASTTGETTTVPLAA